MSGVITWITGLSAAGKTTLGVELTKRLQNQFEPVVFLDGDNLRTILGEDSTHTRDDRLRLAFIYSRLCRSIAAQNVHVVISTVALFREIHVWNRENFDNLIEVFLKQLLLSKHYEHMLFLTKQAKPVWLIWYPTPGPASDTLFPRCRGGGH